MIKGGINEEIDYINNSVGRIDSLHHDNQSGDGRQRTC